MMKWLLMTEYCLLVTFCLCGGIFSFTDRSSGYGGWYFLGLAILLVLAPIIRKLTR